MFAKHGKANHGRLLLPGVAVVLAYLVLFAVPRHRECNQVSDLVRQRSASVEQLRLRVKSQPPPDTAEDLATTTKLVSRNGNEQTSVQAFAQLLSIFQSNGVDCTAAKPDEIDRQKLAGGITHRVFLTGNFYDVVAAMETIEARLPHALTVDFSLERPDPSDVCRWEIAFRFKERIQ